jgi:hypothetical protein
VRWSELPPARLEIELAKLGITAKDLVKDLDDVPELRETLKHLSSRDAKRLLALEWFGDQCHPQPEKRTRPYEATFDGEPAYLDLTPDWGRLPRLEDEEADPGGAEDLGKTTRGAKSRWRRADLETILVTQRSVSARKLAASDDLIEQMHHQRISELRARSDIKVENDKLVLPAGCIGAQGGWITLPKLG